MYDGTMSNAQIESLLDVVKEVLGDDVVAAYLYGSAVMGGLHPHSDIDMLVVMALPTTRDEKRALIERLLEISLSPRPLELTVVVLSDVKPWRYPPRMELQYGDWWRKEFERGDLAPWGSDVNPDLASLIRMVLASGKPLIGPPPSEVFDPVPSDDYRAALLEGFDGLENDLESDARNMILTAARIWSSLSTDELRSKDAAADWALERLPPEQQGVLSEARDIYLGVREPWSDAPVEEARRLIDHIREQIHPL